MVAMSTHIFKECLTISSDGIVEFQVHIKAWGRGRHTRIKMSSNLLRRAGIFPDPKLVELPNESLGLIVACAEHK